MDSTVKVLLFGLGGQLGLVVGALKLFLWHNKKSKEKEGKKDEGTANTGI